MDVFESCREKCANLCRVYKVIMVSRVPGYGHFEYLELDIIVDLITLKLIELSLMMILVNWGLSSRNLLKYWNNLGVVYINLFLYCRGKLALCKILNLEPPPAKYCM